MSAFFLQEFNDCQISEFTRITVISTQFSGGSYLVKSSTFFLGPASCPNVRWPFRPTFC